MNWKQIALIITLLPLGLLAQQGQSREELQRKTQQLLKEIEEVKADLAEAQKNKKQTLGLLRKIEQKINLRNQIIQNIKGEVYLVEKDIIRTYRDIDTLKAELATLKQQYAQSVVYAYKNRSNYDFLNFLFSAGSFSDALKRVSYLKTYRSYRTQKAADITRTQTNLEAKIASLTGKRQQKTDALTLESKQMVELESEKKDKDKVIAQISGQEKELRKMLANREKERKQLQNAIAVVIRREREEALRKEREEAKKKADAAAKNGSGTTGNATAANTNAAKPAGSATTAPPKRIEQYSDGVTMETTAGAPVKAVFEGEVSRVFSIANNVQVVMVKHGKYFTTYSNLSSVEVSKGQKVSAGQVLGKAGVNDFGVGEVSFQIDTERGTQNPEQWLRRR
ncbi:MAG: peptidoglycan DD-metalloendopeptidase family protein [Chitinophagaceae bacterium]|nr:peptidoglycan DD-metalloendopeptidase family protein [Chitinophagaceae bacterium]